jgi:hypothetical protein
MPQIQYLKIQRCYAFDGALVSQLAQLACTEFYAILFVVVGTGSEREGWRDRGGSERGGWEGSHACGGCKERIFPASSRCPGLAINVVHRQRHTRSHTRWKPQNLEKGRHTHIRTHTAHSHTSLSRSHDVHVLYSSLCQ